MRQLSVQLLPSVPLTRALLSELDQPITLSVSLI
jgi:hypothetical protein